MLHVCPHQQLVPTQASEKAKGLRLHLKGPQTSKVVVRGCFAAKNIRSGSQTHDSPWNLKGW